MIYYPILWKINESCLYWQSYSNEYYLYKVCMINFRPQIKEKDVPRSYIKLVESCQDDDKLKRPTFNDICIDLRSNSGFITDNIDQNEFLNYVLNAF